MSTDEEESLLTFPCEFPIKVMGLAGDEFEIAVLTIMRAHFPNMKQDALKVRKSKEAKYMSITTTVTVQNQAELDAVYQALAAHPLVILSL